MVNQNHEKRIESKNRWNLVMFDVLFYLVICAFIFVLYPSAIDHLTPADIAVHTVIGGVCMLALRLILGVYKRVWRYATSRDYLVLVIADFFGGTAFILMRYILPNTVTFVRAASLVCLNLLSAITIRLMYQYVYQNRNSGTKREAVLLTALRIATGVRFESRDPASEVRKIRVAIIGAGSIGAMLAEELLSNPKAAYIPVCFVDINQQKIGREIAGIPIVSGRNVQAELNRFHVQEVVFAIPNASYERHKELYETYKEMGYKIKSYDYPVLESAGARRGIRDFAIEDLLYRHQVDVIDEATASWYRGKAVMITGGGGSIGSELARQIAKVGPSRLVLLDVYENGVYDVQQELKMKYGDALNLKIEICSICDREQLDRIFMNHTPDIVLHAAAHKHVPLMERNVCEAVKNNVFGTLNVVEICEKYNVKRFIMVSTDKAVNPTNVMGATKRMCEMIVQARSGERTSFSATRFGNVLGSNGSVIPLFKRQIKQGGPVTITDKRITRYFMTIPEASQLVMISGVMASNGELYVLDMGNPIKIFELAKDMIRLSGLEPYKDIDIVEIGLRPGEKLYEELLIKTEELDRTDNDLIFVERDNPLSQSDIDKKLQILRAALESGSNRVVRKALMEVVPTFRLPKQVNDSVNVA